MPSRSSPCTITGSNLKRRQAFHTLLWLPLGTIILPPPSFIAQNIERIELVEPSVVMNARLAPAIIAISDCASAIGPEGLPSSSV